MGQAKLTTDKTSKGFLVWIKKNERIGRTYHNKEKVNGKVPVYLEETPGKHDFKEPAHLFHETDITVIGFID